MIRGSAVKHAPARSGFCRCCCCCYAVMLRCQRELRLRRAPAGEKGDDSGNGWGDVYVRGVCKLVSRSSSGSSRSRRSGTSTAAVSKPQSRRKMIGSTLVAEHVKQKRSRHQGTEATGVASQADSGCRNLSSAQMVIMATPCPALVDTGQSGSRRDAKSLFDVSRPDGCDGFTC